MSSSKLVGFIFDNNMDSDLKAIDVSEKYTPFFSFVYTSYRQCLFYLVIKIKTTI